MAVAISWTGHVDTNMSFADFYDADHTIVVSFMPQFSHAHERPIG